MQQRSSTRHILIIASPYYKEITDELIKGATAELVDAGATYEISNVTGALEIPQALAAAIDNGLFDSEGTNEGYFHGVIVLGCVIRGETSHYDIVAEQSAAKVMHLAVDETIPLGNGILTVETELQAMVRASTTEKNKGRDAAKAALRLIELNEEYAQIAEDEGLPNG